MGHPKLIDDTPRVLITVNGENRTAAAINIISTQHLEYKLHWEENTNATTKAYKVQRTYQAENKGN